VGSIEEPKWLQKLGHHEASSSSTARPGDRQARRVLIVPMASSLDAFVSLMERALACSNLLAYSFSIVLLSSTLESLSQDGCVRTLERCAAMLSRFGSAESVFLLPNSFMSNHGHILERAIDAVTFIKSRVSHVSVVVLSENTAFRSLLERNQLQGLRTSAFFELLGNEELLQEAQIIDDTLNTDHESGKQRQNDSSSWWTEDEINRRKSELVVGIMEKDMFNSDVIKIKVGSNLPDLIFSSESTNRAVHGDEVAVYSDRIVRVIQRNWRPYVVSLSREDNERLLTRSALNATRALMCVPLDPRIPKIRLVSRQGHVLQGQRFVVAIDEWPSDSHWPKGHYMRMLGPIGDPGAESAAILVETGLETHLGEFSQQALSCMPVERHSWFPREEDGLSRRDLRKDRLVFSVDPPGCQDIDDAMSFTKLEGNLVEVGVHIADVTHFVQENSALDDEARLRATSVYLEDHRLDMLPRLLCEDLCSLRADVDRLAVSVIWKLDLSGTMIKVVDSWAGRTIIRSAHALSYNQAQRLIEGQDPGAEKFVSHTGKPIKEAFWEDLAVALRGLQSLARMREQERTSHGALALESGEFKFSFDASHRPNDVSEKKKLEIHGTVAEMMIFANEEIARRICQKLPQKAFVRRHVKPTQKKMAEVLSLAKEANVAVDVSSNATLAASMLKIRRELRPETFAVINDALTRAMSEAEYTCTGLVNDISHFGLGLTHYTHFTSPIRRYADVVVHRQLLCEDKTSLEVHSEAREPPVEQSTWIDTINREKKDHDALYFTALSQTERDDLLDDVLGEDATFGDDILDEILEERNDPQFGPPKEPSQLNTTSDADEQRVWNHDSLSEVAKHINNKHRAAKEASHRSSELFFSLFFQRFPQVVSAIVISIREHGCVCFVPKFQTKFSLRFPKDGALDVCVKDHQDMLKVETLSNVSLNLENFPNKKDGFAVAHLSCPSETFQPRRLEILGLLPLFIFANQAESRVPRPRLVFCSSDAEWEHLGALSRQTSASGPAAVQEFARSGTPLVPTSLEKEGSNLETNAIPAGLSLYDVMAGKPKLKKRKVFNKDETHLNRVVHGEGRFIFGGFLNPESQGKLKPCEQVYSELQSKTSTSQSFTSIQHDRGAVNKFVKNLETKASTRIKALEKAKRETKTKKRLKKG